MKKLFLLIAMALPLMTAGLTLNGQESDVIDQRLMKSFNGETLETTKNFQVSGGYSLLRIAVFGTVKSGKISLTFTRPDGVLFKTIEIDAASDVRYQQSFDMTKNPEGIIGNWNLKVQTEGAEGSYNVQIYSR